MRRGGVSTEWGLVEEEEFCVKGGGGVMEAPGVPTGSVRWRKGKRVRVGLGRGPALAGGKKNWLEWGVGESCGEG